MAEKATPHAEKLLCSSLTSEAPRNDVGGMAPGKPRAARGKKKGLKINFFFFSFFSSSEFLQVLVLERNAVRDTRIVAGWHWPREGRH